MSHIKVNRANGICEIRIDRADRMNAIDDEMTVAITRAFESLAGDRETRVVLLSAAGANYSAGGDLQNLAEWLSPDPQVRSDKFRSAVSGLSKPLSLALQRTPQPIVAAVRGHAIGVALQMIIMADIVVASETARFSMPQLNLAHTPDHGESWALPRKIGLARALQMSLLAERLDAATAERYGLVNIMVPDDELDARAHAVVQQIAGSPPVAAREAKALLWGSESISLEQALDREVDSIGKAVRKDDFVEAITAFVEKRKPVFTGN